MSLTPFVAEASTPEVLSPSPKAGATAPMAYSYVRFSHGRQKNGDSLRRQLALSREYADKHGLQLQELTYRDLGLSAFRGDNIERGALAAFIKAVEDGSIRRGSYLLVENFDRLSRAEVHIALQLLLRLVSAGIVVATLMDGKVWNEQTVADTANLMVTIIFMGRAHDESVGRSKRIREIHQAKRARRDPAIFGQGPAWVVRKPDGSGWDLKPGMAESIRRVFELSIQGVGSTAIARLANAEGWVAPAKVERWNTTLPNKLLRNRAVLGEYEPKEMKGSTRVTMGEVWTDYYPRVVDEDTFLKAQAAAHNRLHLPNRRDAGYHNVLQGFAFCGHCGQTLLRKRKGGSKNSLGYAQYMCSGRHCGETQCPTAAARPLEQRLLPNLVRNAVSEVARTDRLAALRDLLDTKEAEHRDASKAAERILTMLQSASSPLLEKRFRELDGKATAAGAEAEALRAELHASQGPLCDEDVEDAIGKAAYSTRWRTRLHADGGQCSSVMADAVPR
ncbi:recombinase family protein [Hydrogenophaga intermedia]|uniref:recombinase family protein n=1 Tax=Hydrogenophaga intermedia TaxID=65786 RepID=UPI0020435FEB|nr:recombinase family protein [Hydrogenophaga intermedia]MCM3565557.1 recombinase family protein [Hydrogenophaga intermedia]